MKPIVKYARAVAIVFVLTVFTQVGGLIYLIYKPIGVRIQRTFQGPKKYLRFAVFLCLYLIMAQWMTPVIARKLGRTPLPLSNDKLRPASTFIWLANRHYVKPELLDLLEDTSNDLPSNVSIVYLDANFPFIDGFPLFGHLSHNDGEKVDLAFIYSNADGIFLNGGKSLSGYGIAEGPQGKEVDQPTLCEERGHWQYSLPTRFTLMERYKNYHFDNKANRALLRKLASDQRIGKIFIEPHLRDRLNLNQYSKIRFHGCHAVRHDDHIHIQL